MTVKMNRIALPFGGGRADKDSSPNPIHYQDGRGLRRGENRFSTYFFRTITLDCSCCSRFTARRCPRVDEGFFSDFPRDLSATVAPFSEVPSDRPRPYVRKNKKPVRRSRPVRPPARGLLSRRPRSATDRPEGATSLADRDREPTGACGRDFAARSCSAWVERADRTVPVITARGNSPPVMGPEPGKDRCPTGRNTSER
jgi:hypothetical protein